MRWKKWKYKRRWANTFATITTTLSCYYKCSFGQSHMRSKKHYSNCFLMQCKQSNPLCIYLFCFQPHLECMYSLVSYGNPLLLVLLKLFHEKIRFPFRNIHIVLRITHQISLCAGQYQLDHTSKNKLIIYVIKVKLIIYRKTFFSHTEFLFVKKKVFCCLI